MGCKDEEIVISVIVPSYNAEQYIGRLIKSILQQTYTKFELIIVNDGSTDCTADICEAFCEADDRIVLKTQENGGPSAARNNGIECARGEYITFADADDECEKKWLEEMLKKRQQTDCDMVMCNWYEVNGNEEKSYDAFPEEMTISVPQFIQNMHGLSGAVWNKLFLKKIIKENHLAFDVNRKRCEDFLFIIDYVLCCHTVGLVSEPLYRYTIMQSSLSHMSQMYDFYMQVLGGEIEAVSHAKRARRVDCEKALRTYVINSCFNCIVLMEEQQTPDRYVRQALKCAESLQRSMTKKQHLYFALASISPYLYSKIWRKAYTLKRGR